MLIPDYGFPIILVPEWFYLADFRDVNTKKDALYLNQDVDIYLSSLEMGQEVKHTTEADHHLWVQAIRGSLILNGKNLEQADGASISNEQGIEISTNDLAEFLLFDME